MKLLLVEDEKIELDTLRNYVDWRSCGIDEVFTARGGRSALEIVYDQSPDIIITDIHMPGMTGMEMANILREEGITAKIVFLTGYDRFEYAKEAIKLQASEFLLKPFQIDEVEEVTKKLVAEIRKEKDDRSLNALALGKMIENACYGKLDGIEEMSERYFSKSAGQILLNIVALNRIGHLERDRLLSIPEIIYSFELYGLVFAFFSNMIIPQPFVRRLQNILAVSEKKPQIIYTDQPVNLLHLEETCQQCALCKDDLFYLNEDDIFSVGDHSFWNEFQDRVANMYEKKKLLEELKRSNEAGADQLLENCFGQLKDMKKDAFARNAFSLLLYLKRGLQEITTNDIIPQTPDMFNAVNYHAALASAKNWLGECCRQRNKVDDHQWSTYVKEYVAVHYMEDCSVEEMAEALGLSPNYLRRKFKEENGITILEYVTERRLMAAAEMLEESNMKIKDVSKAVGYPNVSYFTQIFTKKFGFRPNDYKHRIR